MHPSRVIPNFFQELFILFVSLEDCLLVLGGYFNPRKVIKTNMCVCVRERENVCVCVMNLATTHYNCTSPMDYISHHTLHSHIPIHHHTNHTAVTNHSFALIASPHLHLIHPLTYKQHTYTHPLRSVVFPWLTFLSVLPIHPAISVFHPGLPDLGSLNLCL